MSQLEARWIKKDNQSIISNASNALTVQTVATGGIEVTTSGIQIKTGGVTNDMLAGSIADSKLEKVYLYADGTRPLTGNLNLNNNRITNLANATNPSDAVTLSQLQELATQGKAWKEVLLYSGQLSANGIHAAQVIVLNSNLVAGDTITLNDGTTTQNLVAGTNFSIGTTINDTLQNLRDAINAGSIAISAYVTTLDSIDSTNEILVVWQDTVGEPTRIYGNASASAKVRILDPTLPNVYEGVATNLVALPTTDPGSKNFGFFRQKANLTPNETHYDRSTDASYTWDSDASTWQMTGASSVPFASKTTHGKVQVGAGISVASGIISLVAANNGIQINPDTIGVRVSSAANNILTIQSDGIAVLYNTDQFQNNSGTLTFRTGFGLQTTTNGVAVNPNDFTGTGLEYDGVSQKIRIAAAAAGAGLVGGSGSALAVGQGFGITVSTDEVAVNTSDIISTGGGLELDANNRIRISSAVAGAGLSGGSGSALNVNAGFGIQIVSDAVAVNTADIIGFGMEVDGNNKIRIASSALGNGLQGGSGSVISVKAANGISVTASGVGLGTLSADWNVGTTYTIQVKNPVNPTDVANKQWVEQQIENAETRGVETFTLTATDISNKYITLTGTPQSGSSIVLHVKGAPHQFYGDDYTYISATKRISWDNLGLDGLLVAGDKITVVYNS